MCEEWEPSDLQLMVWDFIELNGHGPMWESVAGTLAGQINSTEPEIDEEIREAIRAGELIPILDEDDDWILNMPPELMDAVAVWHAHEKTHAEQEDA